VSDFFWVQFEPFGACEIERRPRGASRAARAALDLRSTEELTPSL